MIVKGSNVGSCDTEFALKQYAQKASEILWKEMFPVVGRAVRTQEERGRPQLSVVGKILRLSAMDVWKKLLHQASVFVC